MALDEEVRATDVRLPEASDRRRLLPGRLVERPRTMSTFRSGSPRRFSIISSSSSSVGAAAAELLATSPGSLRNETLGLSGLDRVGASL